MRFVLAMTDGRDSPMAMVADYWSACHESTPSATEDPPVEGLIHVKSVETLMQRYSTCGPPSLFKWPTKPF
ncbi:hypothetical protein TNCV_4838581 [Trichonephila clavipes]|nr:hypothetical protein TNCV_4838581 [Trichonephila clavipes]